MLIYFCCRPWFKHADVNSKQAAKASTSAAPVQELTKEQTKSRIVALVLAAHSIRILKTEVQFAGRLRNIFRRRGTKEGHS